MGKNLCLLGLSMVLLPICGCAVFYDVSNAHRSAALDVFSPRQGLFGTLQEAYQAIRVFQSLGIETETGIRASICPVVLSNLESSSSSLKDILSGLNVNEMLKCDVKEDIFKGIALRLQSADHNANSLLHLFHLIECMVHVKDKTSEPVELEAVQGLFHSVKGFLRRGDGKWRSETSILDAGLAFQALSGVITLAPEAVQQSLVDSLEQDITDFFNIKGRFGAITTTPASVSAMHSILRGMIKFMDVTSREVHLAEDWFAGTARYFLGLGIPVKAEDFFYQIDSLTLLENNRVFIPLFVFPVAGVVSTSSDDPLRVKLSTALGTRAPQADVKLVRVATSPPSPLLENIELNYDPETGVYVLENVFHSIDIGHHIFIFEASGLGLGPMKVVQSEIPITITGPVQIVAARAIVTDTEFDSIDTTWELDLTGGSMVSLSANHHQTLRISVHLKTPLGNAFNPHQVFLELHHEGGVAHVFVLAPDSGGKFETVLDFLRLAQRFSYVSGVYSVRLTVGDSVMENSVTTLIGSVELHLPDPPERVDRTTPIPLDPHSRYGPKPEISHVFRSPEKRSPLELSYSFLALVLVPLLVFLAGLVRLGVNWRNFPASSVPASIVAVLFQLGIGAVLFLYVMFWVKLDLFTTLKMLGVLGMFLAVVGHFSLSMHAAASASSKVKSA